MAKVFVSLTDYMWSPTKCCGSMGGKWQLESAATVRRPWRASYNQFEGECVHRCAGSLGAGWDEH